MPDVTDLKKLLSSQVITCNQIQSFIKFPLHTFMGKWATLEF